MTFNIEGFHRNNYYLSQLLDTLAPKIIFLQEIWVPYSEESGMNKIFPDYSIQISTPDMFIPAEDKLGSPDHTWHGSAVMWHASLNSMITCLKTTHARFTGVKLKTQNLHFLIISVYFPTSGKDHEYLECVTELVNYVTEHRDDNETILIGSDSNCSDRSSLRRRLAFENLCKDLELRKFSCSQPTFHHHNGSSESNIDYFLMSAGSTPKIINIFKRCTLETPQNFSSHDPVSATLQFPATGSNVTSNLYSHTYTNFSRKKIIWNQAHIEQYQQTAGNILTLYDDIFSLPEHIPLKCELFSTLLVKAADLCMESRCDKTRKKKAKPSHQLHSAWQQLEKTFSAWKRAGKPKNTNNPAHIRYKKARSIFQCRYRQEMNLKIIKENNSIMHADYENKNEFFNWMKKIRNTKHVPTLTTLNTPAGSYYGSDTLEGFAVDAEILGQYVGESKEYDNDFYRLCIMDNHYIFEFKGEDSIKIPNMKIEDLEKILNEDMKLGKACDIYKLSVEHLRYAGHQSKLIILKLLNDIVDNIYYLTCPQVKKGLSTAVYKGKKKPIADSSSYRRITVTPQIGGILDRYIDPIAEDLFQKVQSPDQLGFTKHISYLLGAVLRVECQRWALDTKQTCFGVTFDGKAAFPSVDRDILIRELHGCGENGDLLQYSSNTYKNTVSHIKQDNKLSREFREFKGSRQGHKRAVGHFKSYINPCLTATNSSQLGFWIGPICVTSFCIADDTYVLSGDPRKLQDIINIVGHYGRRYRLVFGADKTKVTITGSNIDMKYYKDVNIWSLYGQKLVVAENNEHLGLIVSGTDEEIKNVDKNIDSARKTMFSLLGQTLSYKCKLSPTVQHHIWIIFIKPVLRSGLPALPIRPTALNALTTFYHKTLRGILKLSTTSPVAPLYFLLGELPIEATIHLDLFSLFWNIWSNPQTTVFEVVKYILKMSHNNSLTWSAHLRILFQLYSLPDPLALMEGSLWPKEKWKEY